MPKRSLRPSRCALASLITILAFAGCVGGLVPVIPEPEGSAADDVSNVVAAATIDEYALCTEVGLPRTLDHAAVTEALNAYREANGLEPLIYSKSLERAAEAMAQDIVDRDFFDHIDPDGNTPPDRALATGFCHKYVGENLATGFQNVDAVMEAWEASEGHNANLLNPEYAYIGIGVLRTASNGAVWVQEFAYDPGVVALSTSSSLAR